MVVDLLKTYSIIQFIRLFYKFLAVENKKSGVEKFKVINRANFRKKGWKKLIHPNNIFYPLITHIILSNYPQMFLIKKDLSFLLLYQWSFPALHLPLEVLLSCCFR